MGEFDDLEEIAETTRYTTREHSLHGKRRPLGQGGLTHCKMGHVFDEKNTRLVRRAKGTVRVCKACHRERNKLYYHNRSEKQA